MADDHWLQWQAEMARSNRLPSIGAVWLLFASLALVLIVLIGPDRLDHAANDGKPSTLCAEHAGRPGWDSVCGGRYTPPPARP